MPQPRDFQERLTELRERKDFHCDKAREAEHEKYLIRKLINCEIEGRVKASSIIRLKQNSSLDPDRRQRALDIEKIQLDELLDSAEGIEKELAAIWEKEFGKEGADILLRCDRWPKPKVIPFVSQGKVTDIYFEYPTGYGNVAIKELSEVKRLRRELAEYEKEAATENTSFEKWLDIKWYTAGADMTWGSLFGWPNCIKARVQLWELDKQLGPDWWKR